MTKRKTEGVNLFLPVIHVQTLGQFAVSVGERSIDNQANQAKKPWSILEYLITNRNREISSNELIELIWADEESNNPGGALKTLIFRSRKLLEPLEIPPQDLIVQKRGSYAWNTDYEIIVDADEFESLCNSAASLEQDEERQLDLYLQALNLYKGDFLPKSSWEAWVIPISTYYHSLYLQTAHRCIQLLSGKDRWKDVIDLCKRAISVEQFDEDFHYYLIYALYNIGEQNRAMEHYRFATELFYNEFSITPSERLKDLYKIIRDEKHGVTTDLTIIQDSMQEEQNGAGAYYCEFTVFRDIYQLEQRAIGRTGDSIYLCLLTIRNAQDELPKSSIMVRAMESLNTAITHSLRRGDVYCRYSIAQYMILLPTASYENGITVMKRIIHNFKKYYSRRELTVDFSLQSVTSKS